MNRAASPLLATVLVGTLIWLTGCAPTSAPQSVQAPLQTATAIPLPLTQPPAIAAPTAEQAALFAGTYQVLGDAKTASTPRQLTLVPVAGTDLLTGTLLTQQERHYALNGTLDMSASNLGQLDLTVLDTGGAAVGTLSAYLRREGQQAILEGQYQLGSAARHLYSYKALTAVAAPAPGSNKAAAASTPVVSPTPQPSASQTSSSTQTSVPVFVTPTPGPLPQ